MEYVWFALILAVIRDYSAGHMALYHAAFQGHTGVIA